MRAFTPDEPTKLAGVALVASLLLLAAPAAGAPATFAQERSDQITDLECAVTATVTNLNDGQVSETTDRGAWKVTLLPLSSVAIDVRGTDTYFIDGQRNRLDGHGRDVQATEDAYTFCLMLDGCGVTIRTVRNDGWYRVSRSRLDRRHGVFTTTVETLDGPSGLHQRFEYSGPCAPPPEQQF